MKKFIMLVLALVCVLSLVGCATAEKEIETRNTNATQESIASNKEDVSTETTEDLSEIPGGTLFIVEIRDRAKEESLPCDTAFEKFHEDESNEYYFSVIKSQYVIVTYNDGSSEDIVTALTAGRVSMNDLDEFDIEYNTKAKK